MRGKIAIDGTSDSSPNETSNTPTASQTPKPRTVRAAPVNLKIEFCEVSLSNLAETVDTSVLGSPWEVIQ